MATTTYQSKVGACQIGGVDHSGAAHDPLVFTKGSPLTLNDDMQEYAQTLKNALDTGTIEVVADKPKSKAKES